MGRLYRRILMIYPEFPKTYWGMYYSLAAISKKALMPPLGLITIAALTPPEYEIRLIDLNRQKVSECDFEWADMICFSAMLIQKKSLFETAQYCKQIGKLIVFGGPYPTSCPDECEPYCDVLVLDEGEITWPIFLKDLEENCYKKIYRTMEKPDVTKTPVPRFDLLNVLDYLCMSIQYSRGCPFQCEFCDIIVLFGRRPRTKRPEQIIKELEALFDTGYRGFVFMVDDNFIGNKKEVKNLLPKIRDWNKSKGYPFYFATEASINLSDDQELLKGMVESLFVWVFVGLESPSEESLKETKKLQNIGKPLADRVKIIQKAGLIVWGGFILGFDSDQEDIFDRQLQFIQQTAIANAAVGLLYALTGTPLYSRIKQAGRLALPQNNGLEADAGTVNHFESSFTNIVTVIPQEKLVEGYYHIMRNLYTPANYFDRVFLTLCRLPGPRSPIAEVKRVAWLGKILTKNFYIQEAPSNGKPARSAISKLKYLNQKLSELPVEFKNEAKRFAWQVLKTCPHQIRWVMPYLLMGSHYYLFTFEHVLPKNNVQLLKEEPELTMS